MVAGEFTTKLLEVATDGEVVIWSSGAQATADAAPDLFMLRPGDCEPRLVYGADDRAANLIPIGAGGGHFAFVESNTVRNGPGTWTLWYMESADAEPMAVDQGDGAEGAPSAPPFFALSDDRLVWATFHEIDGVAHSQIPMVQLPNLEPQVIESRPADQVQFWFPALDGDRLVYGTIESSTTGAEQRHIYLRDLGDTDSPPTRLDSDGQAAMPAIAGDTVVWKQGDPDLHILNAGRLVRYSIADRSGEPLDLGEDHSFPSVGARYLTSWTTDSRELSLYDLAMDEPVAISFDLGPSEAIVRPDLAGSLLAWVRGSAEPGTELTLWFAELP